MTITALPTPPNRSMSSDAFVTAADAFLAALPTFATEANALAVAMNLNSTTDTSATSNAIGTGAKTFTVTAGKSFQGGMYVVIADAAAPSTNLMVGSITSYSSTSLVANIEYVRGSGTFTSWVISQSAPAANIAAQIHGATNKTTPVGADEVGIWDSVSGLINRVSFTNLVTYFSGLCSAGWNAATATLATNATSATTATTAAGASGLFDISGASAGQIKFPSTQNASADANTLDDYEEGTFTPTIFSNGGSITGTGLAGHYTKIGRLVNFTINLQVASVSAPTGALSFGGLPFTHAALSGSICAIRLSGLTANSSTSFNAFIFASDTTGQIVGVDSGGVNSVALSPFVTSSFSCTISGVYPAA